METFKFVKEVPLADADGIAIAEGSVLRHVEDGTRGVVTWVGRAGAPRDGPALSAVGDIGIYLRAGSTRVTNKYHTWRHIPHDEQTYAERLVAWEQKHYKPDPEREDSRAIDGIMSLLPSDAVDWDYGPHPDTLEDALRFLTAHLTQITKQNGQQQLP